MNEKERALKQAAQWLSIGIVVLLIWSTVRYFVAIQPLIGGVDFYHYVLFARDGTLGYKHIPATKYGYFPGIYVFWHWVMVLFGTRIATLQWVFVGLLSANAALTSWVIFRFRNSLFVSVVSGLLYVVLASVFEGYIGATEPLNTFFLLVTLAAWLGRPLLNREGAYRSYVTSIILGLGFGCVVFSKQQGILLLAGLGCFLPDLIACPRERRVRLLLSLAAIPIIATLVVVIGSWLEKGDLYGLELGVGAVGAYAAQGSFLGNLAQSAARVQFVPLLGTILSLGWLLDFGARIWRRTESSPRQRVMDFCALATLAALYQLTKRSYAHYLLLGIPSFLIWLVLSFIELKDRCSSWSKLLPTTVYAALIICLVYISASPRTYGSLRFWPPQTLFTEYGFPAYPRPASWYETYVPELCSHLSVGENILMVPSREGEIQWICGTRTEDPFGYGWGPGVSDPVLSSMKSGELSAFLKSGEISALLFPKTDGRHFDRETWPEINPDVLIEIAKANGFKLVADNPVAALYSRAPSPEYGH